MGAHERAGGELAVQQILSKIDAAEHFLKTKTEPQTVSSLLMSDEELSHVEVLLCAR